MVDNHKGDMYHYQVLVFTGNRRNAGTASKVWHIALPTLFFVFYVHVSGPLHRCR